MSILRRLRRWCPQPKTPVPANFARLSTPIFASALIAEIVILLIAPITFYALLVSKNVVVAPDQTLPLTNTQIKASWPNLPTAKETVNGSYGYSSIDSSMASFDQVKNYTWISPVNAIPQTYPVGGFVTRLVPVEYNIWLKLNDTTWVSVDSSYLENSTNNPPYALPSSLYVTERVGFLGTGLPSEYVIIATAVIAVTSLVGVIYLFHNKKQGTSR